MIAFFCDLDVMKVTEIKNRSLIASNGFKKVQASQDSAVQFV